MPSGSTLIPVPFTDADGGAGVSGNGTDDGETGGASLS